MNETIQVLQSRIEKLRNPEYTGDNRCTPCTVVNVAITAVLGAAVAVVSVPAAAVVAVVGMAAIYFRGYLVPGTPTLTKRYFPDRVLAWFDKRPVDELPSDEDGLVDVESALHSMGVVEPCKGGTDLCLEPDFRVAWYDHAETMQSDDERRSAIAEMLDVETSKLSFDEYGSAVVVRFEGKQVGQWESDAALVADLAADRALSAHTVEWDRLDVVNRSRVLNSLRMFLEECPACGGPATMGQETVESCCRSIDVVAVTCQDCGSRLFEIEVSPELERQLT